MSKSRKVRKQTNQETSIEQEVAAVEAKAAAKKPAAKRPARRRATTKKRAAK